MTSWVGYQDRSTVEVWLSYRADLAKKRPEECLLVLSFSRSVLIIVPFDFLEQVVMRVVAELLRCTC